MNTCREVNQQFSCYLEGDLDAPKQAEVEAHLQECASCRAELERFQRLLGLLEELPPPASAGLSLDGFRSALAAWRRRRRRRVQWGLAAAALASLVMGLGWWRGQDSLVRGSRPSGPTLAWLGKQQPLDSNRSLTSHASGGKAGDKGVPSEETKPVSPLAKGLRSSGGVNPGAYSQADSEGYPPYPPFVKGGSSLRGTSLAPFQVTRMGTGGRKKSHSRPHRLPRSHDPKIRLVRGPKKTQVASGPAQVHDPTSPQDSPLDQGAYYLEVYYPNGGYAVLTSGDPEVLAEMGALRHSTYDVQIINTATGESNRLRLEQDVTVGGLRENVTLEFEEKVAEKNLSEEERKDESQAMS